MIKSKNKTETVESTSSLHTKRMFLLDSENILTIIERKRTHEGVANPTFEKKRGSNLQNRYGVYAVIPDANHEKIILVQAPNGMVLTWWGEAKPSRSSQTRNH